MTENHKTYKAMGHASVFKVDYSNSKNVKNSAQIDADFPAGFRRCQRSMFPSSTCRVCAAHRTQYGLALEASLCVRIPHKTRPAGREIIYENTTHTRGDWVL